MIQVNDLSPLPLDKNKTLLEQCLDHKIDLNHSCGGHATCGTCRVFIENHKDLPKRNHLELEMANSRGFSPSERLSCQIKADRPLVVKTV